MNRESESAPVWVTFLPSGRRVQAAVGSRVLTVAQRAGIDLAAVCGGVGTCGACRVRLLDGVLSDPTPAENRALSPQQFAQGFRLACQAHILGEVRLEIPLESALEGFRLQVEGQETVLALDPLVTPVDLSFISTNFNRSSF